MQEDCETTKLQEKEKKKVVQKKETGVVRKDLFPFPSTFLQY